MSTSFKGFPRQKTSIFLLESLALEVVSCSNVKLKLTFTLVISGFRQIYQQCSRSKLFEMFSGANANTLER